MKHIAAVVLAGCLLAACTSTGGGGSTTGGGGGTQIPADVYFIDAGLTVNSVRAFSSGPVAGGGQPSELAGSPFLITPNTDGSAGAPFGMSLALNGSVLYAVSAPARKVSLFTVSANGTLAFVNSYALTGTTPAGICVDPMSLYAAIIDTAGTVDVFNITPITGVLGPDVNMAITGSSAPVACAFSSDSKYLYISNSGVANKGISAFTVAAGPTLTTILGSPFNTTTPADFQGIATTSSATVIAASRAGNGAAVFQITGTGALASPAVLVPTAIAPIGLAVTPNGKYLYLGASGAQQVDAYAINGTSLVRLSGAPYFTAVPSTYVSVSGAGNLLAALDPINQGVSFFAINSDGTLSAAPIHEYVFNTNPGKPAAIVAR